MKNINIEFNQTVCRRNIFIILFSNVFAILKIIFLEIKDDRMCPKINRFLSFILLWTLEYV
ncbi:hypothetical protein PGB90_002593 [Kerria lacca]